MTTGSCVCVRERDRLHRIRLSADQERGKERLLSEGHLHAARGRALVEAAQQALAGGAQPIEHGEVALDLVVISPEQAPSDATNYLGIGDVLQAKTSGALVKHLGPRACVSLFTNDRQVREVGYRVERGPAVMYRLSVRPPLAAVGSRFPPRVNHANARSHVRVPASKPRSQAAARRLGAFGMQC
jgi:hypothetical protein